MRSTDASINNGSVVLLILKSLLLARIKFLIKDDPPTVFNS